MRLAVLLGLVALVAAAAVYPAGGPVAAQPQGTVRIDHVDVSAFPSVRVTTTVVGPDGRPKLGLNAGNFDVLQSGYPVNRLDVQRDQGGAVDLVIAMDVSRSMAGDPLESAKHTAIALIDALRASDRAAILSFADNTRPLVDFTSDKDVLKQAIQGLEAGSYTAFYDSVFAAVRTAASGSAPGRAVVVMSDGQEYSLERYKEPAKIVEEALVSGIQVYTVYFGIELPTTLFTEIGAITGGRHFDGSDNGLIGGLTGHLDQTLRQR
jgi:Ca-activated chloride channel family protein